MKRESANPDPGPDPPSDPSGATSLFEDLSDLPIVILPDDFDLSVAEIPPGEGVETLPRVEVGIAPRRVSIARRFARVVGSVAAVIVLALGLTIVTFGLRLDFLSAYYPSPGSLSSAHADIVGPSGVGNCKSCHHDAGFQEGCLSCHEEIGKQLATNTGLHPYILRGKDGDCSGCHREHLGAEHRLANRLSWSGQDSERFRHAHVAFALEGKHLGLKCAECHEGKLPEKFSLPAFPDRPRQRTRLGLRQECTFCHEDVHSEDMSNDCASCHGQDTFRPTVHFDHEQHFSLEGAHQEVPCSRCHILPESATAQTPKRLPFDEVRGTRCQECHDSPHRTEFLDSCESCHVGPSSSWATARQSMTGDLHALTGFRLQPPHAEVDCEKCHDSTQPYAARYSDPVLSGSARTEDSCQSCHQDVHGGQFTERGNQCLDCHDRLQFQPHKFPPAQHATTFPLLDAHVNVSCQNCHQPDPATDVRRFVDTPRDCGSCHSDPHAGQFNDHGRECADCHDTKRFVPSGFGLDRHADVFPITGAHVAVPCTSCHVKDGASKARAFVNTPSQCKSCHQNPHGAQFALELDRGDCTACHSDRSDSFALKAFDHERSTGYILEGAHAQAQCRQCHVEPRRAEPSSEPLPIAYRGVSRECASCHGDVHRGQFSDGGHTACSACHESTWKWRQIEFDHNVQSRFALDGSHAHLSCGSCHPRVRTIDGSEIIQFKPIRAECSSCHELQRQ